MHYFSKFICYIIILTTLCILISCNKLVQVSPPSNSITTTSVFSTDNEANSAMLGVYSMLINTNQPAFSNGGTTILCGSSSDEFLYFDQTNNYYYQFQTNTLQPDNSFLQSYLWQSTYSTLYGSNAVIEGLNASRNIHDSIKNELSGEAKFIRAFCNFYLVNLFGRIPLVTTTNWQKTNLLSQSSTEDIYAQIISDLKDAIANLADNYTVGKNQRIIPNKWAAIALLARVNLYTKNWQDAEINANSLINNSTLYNLEENLNDVFLTTSREAIWQLEQSNTFSPSYNSTPEGFQFIPRSTDYPPFIFLSPSLLNSFEANDQRKNSWVSNTTFEGITYYFPYKYKIGPNELSPAGPYTEYYVVLRLAEQYLIRAEARANQNKLSAAIDDLNTIRKRAGLDLLPDSLNHDQVLQAVAQERRIELFSEYGHRWFDLIRTGQAQNILSQITYKQPWHGNYQLLYPIPQSEIVTDPNLIQNPGY